MTRATLSVIGDSQTDYETSYGILPRDTWAGNLGRSLRAAGKDVQVRAFGNSGDTTQSVLDRFASMFLYDTPAMAGIYIGVNDPGASISQATTQLNIEAMCMSLKHGAKGDGLDSAIYVAGQANLPVLGQLEKPPRIVVLSDTSTTGGVAGWHSAHAANIGGSVTGPTVWEHRQPLAGELGWGRVARPSTAPTVVPRIFVVSANYLNWTTGGDSTGTPYATYAPVRAAQAAAVAAQNVNDGNGVASVIFVDLYNFQRTRIVNGTDPDFKSVAYDQTRSWHVADLNQHHDLYGHTLVGQKSWTDIQTAGWLALLPETP